MKKNILILILLSLILSGCSTTAAKKSLPTAPKQGIVSNDIKFERIELDTAPEAVTNLYEKNKEEGNIILIDQGDSTYIVAMMGQKPTGGYSIKVMSVEDNEEGKLKITVEQSEPQPGSMVIQAITYPVDIVKLPKTNLPVYAVDTQGKKLKIEDLR